MVWVSKGSNSDARNPKEAPSSLAREIQNIRSALDRLEHSAPPTTHNGNGFQRQVKLRLSLLRLNNSRKPFLAKFSGSASLERKLSSVRAAILLVLLADLKDRSDGGVGVAHPVEAIAKICYLIEPHKEENHKLLDAVRAAVYRFDVFDQVAEELRANGIVVRLEPKRCRLDFVSVADRDDFLRAQIEFPSIDPGFSEALESIIPTTLMYRVQKRRVLYLPGGPEHFDRLFLEYFDHELPVKELSLYFKPSIVTYPFGLLDFLGASEFDKRRKRVLSEGLKTGRCRFTEILKREHLWDLIRLSSRGGFKIYNRNAVGHHVEEHLRSLIYMMKNIEHYQLVLTDSPFPFLLSTFEIDAGDHVDSSVVFFKQITGEHDPDVSCLVVHDESVLRGIQENVLEWILANPSTEQRREEVVREIEQVLEFFIESGPLPAD